LAITSPGDYYKHGEGSLIQAVFDERAFGRSNEQLVEDCCKQLGKVFPSSQKLKPTWSSVVKLGQSLYREKVGQDRFRPTQATPIPNFFMAGSFTYQDYLDSMEGATRSGIMVADEIIARADGPNGLKAMSVKAKENQQHEAAAAPAPKPFFADAKV
jgi:zeta-carotene desaturase